MKKINCNNDATQWGGGGGLRERERESKSAVIVEIYSID